MALMSGMPWIAIHLPHTPSRQKRYSIPAQAMEFRHPAHAPRSSAWRGQCCQKTGNCVPARCQNCGRTGSLVMPEVVEHQTQELERLERAAEDNPRPEAIGAAAAKPPSTPEEERTAKAWFLPYLIVGAILGAAIFFLDWQDSIFRPLTAERIHRYLLGGMGVVVLLAAAKALDIYVIGRL